jgi:hypothetical protein
MFDTLVEQGYIPLDKSWMIRLGVLDLLSGYDNMINFLSNQKELSEDLEALLRASKQWKENKPVDVGESATLYRCLRYASWQRWKNMEFIKRGTLNKRKICDDPSIIHWPLEKLLTLDGGTTQWWTAACLCGRYDEPFDSTGISRAKIDLTLGAIIHWNIIREEQKCWDVRHDITIGMQAIDYLNLVKGVYCDNSAFVPRQAEDYCFARAFGYISKEEGEVRWPQLRNHESDRIKSMEDALIAAKSGQTVVSDDHRVVQAIAMWSKFSNIPVNFSNPDAVKKSWPQFWRFLDYSSKAA